MTTRDRKAGRAAIGYLFVAFLVGSDTLDQYPEGRYGWRSVLGFVLALLALGTAVDRFRRWRAGRPGE